MTALFQKQKAVQGQEFEFIFKAPAPLVSSPILNVKSANIDANITLTLDRANLDVVAIANDRKTLTLSVATTPLKPLQKDAFLLTSYDSYYPVAIVRISNTTVLLAEAIPKDVEIAVGGSATLSFAIYRTTLPINPYTTNADNLALTVSYIETTGSNALSKNVKGLLKVCPRPFSTGLTHNQVLDNFPNMAEIMSKRQTDLNTIIDGGESDLLLIIRDALASKDCTEDEIFNADIFLQAHLYFTVARLYEILGQFEIAEKMRTRAIALADSALKIVSLDIDGDGVIDTNEVLIPVNGGKPTDLGGNFYGRNISEYENQFTPRRGMRF